MSTHNSQKEGRRGGSQYWASQCKIRFHRSWHSGLLRLAYHSLFWLRQHWWSTSIQSSSWSRSVQWQSTGLPNRFEYVALEWRGGGALMVLEWAVKVQALERDGRQFSRIWMTRGNLYTFGISMIMNFIWLDRVSQSWLLKGLIQIDLEMNAPELVPLSNSLNQSNEICCPVTNAFDHPIHLGLRPIIELNSIFITIREHAACFQRSCFHHQSHQPLDEHVYKYMAPSSIPPLLEYIFFYTLTRIEKNEAR